MPQFSPKEFEELVETAKSAATVSFAVTIWQLLMFFSLRKALVSMFTLINVTQLIVTMLSWQVNLDATLRIVLYKLRSVVLGEFFDDLEIG